ncbi:MAG: molybdenum cofactor biosynthesis protein MoaE [Dehalococcoidia bacterium]|nr:molybdenum cofactor biosynthesis protein MoaE [Dehalococcoidia bacterium]
MKIRIKFFASLRDITRERERVADVPDGSTPASVLAVLGREFPALGGFTSTTAYAVNGAYSASDLPLRDGDEVAFIPPVSGGDGRYVVTDQELSLEEVAAKVRDPSCGAVTVFEGAVRDVSGGRKVLYLEYEAYKEMAEKKLAEIGADVQARWGLDRVAISHRVGRLELGEASVIIAVASPHRAEAFEACRYAIETLKKTVPIWKKEVWEDGEVWVGMEG